MFHFYLTQYDGKILGPIAQGLGYIFSGIYNMLSHVGINNAAVTIIIFTLFVNLLMLPLTIKQQKFAKMQSKMQPEMAKIQQKYKGKKDNASMYAQQEEMKALYEEYGTSPTGGCLPMILTMVVFLALYRVIYAIPAYVPQIKEVYAQVAEIATGNQDALQYIVDAGKELKITAVNWADINISSLKENTDYIIDAFTKFGRSNWDAFASYFSGSNLELVTSDADKIMHINSIFGDLNLAETPMSKPFPGMIVPLLSVIFQYIQTHLVMSKQQTNTQDPTAASMNMMNKTMPIVSGLICLGFPIGNGIYLATNSVFRIGQQLVVNKAMDNMDMDAEIAKNKAKAQKKREKMHLEATDGSVKYIANMKTNSSNVKDIAKMNGAKSGNNNNSEDKKYKKGSIASIAHMMDQSEEE